MSYKKYWVAFAIVIIGSFAVLGGVGRKMISEAPPIPDVYTLTGSSSSLEAPSPMDKEYGSRSVDRKSVRSGVTALMLHPIGARIGCTGNRRSC